MFARLMGLNVISPGKLQQLMQKQPVRVLDVNSRQSWLTARVPGARPLDPMGYDESDLPADKADPNRLTGRNRESRIEDAGRRNYPAAVPEKMRGRNGRSIESCNWRSGGTGIACCGLRDLLGDKE
jgi:hypothetical protein